jgi:hypothetical protein
MALPVFSKGVQELAEVASGHLFAYTQAFRFFSRTPVRAEEKIHDGGDVGVVARMPFFGMMPMMKLRRADQHSQRADCQADIRVNEYCPKPAEGDQACDSLHWKPEGKRGKVDQAHCVHGVQRMLAMGGEPVEMFGAMVNRMNAPKEPEAVLKPMAPIYQEIA